MATTEEEASLESLNDAQDDDLPYQELTMFDFASQGKSTLYHIRHTTPIVYNTLSLYIH
jgi:hypothetical protein